MKYWITTSVEKNKKIKTPLSRYKRIVEVLFILSVVFITSDVAQAQSTSSPYSRYGIGDVNNRAFGQASAMGSASIAVQNDSVAMFFINTANPASYSGVQLTTAELGLNFSHVQLQSAATKRTTNSAAFGYVSIAFPFKKWWGGSFGLIPYSSVGYNVADHQYITNVGAVDFLYEGSGGISQAYFGTAIKPLYGLPRLFMRSAKYKRLKLEKNTYLIDKKLKRKRSLASLSLGGNASYLFGNIENSRTSIFSTGNTFNTRTSNTSRVGGLYFDYGAQYTFTIDSLRGRDLKDNVKITLGATFAAQTDVTAKADSLSYNFYTSSTGYEVIKDTVEYVDGHKGSITLPLSFGAGIALKKGDKFLVAADFAMQNWSSYQAFNSNQGLKNSMRVSVGMQFVPNSKANGFNNYHKRIQYRIGGKYEQTALELKSSQLTQYAATLGIGLPVGRNFLLKNFSMVNIGVELGERGTTNNGLIKERYFKASLGFTINDRWFVKPKFD